MKKYQTSNLLDRVLIERAKYDELRFFQSLLRSNEELNKKYHGKAHAIADGLQPWIDALEITLKS